MINWIGSNFFNILVAVTVLQAIGETVIIINGWKPYADKTDLISKSIFRVIGTPFVWGFFLLMILFAFEYDSCVHPSC